MKEPLHKTYPWASQAQIEQICLGLVNGLTAEQIRLYARPLFTADQMWLIRMGLENGLTAEEIGLFAMGLSDWRQIEAIREALDTGTAPEDIRLLMRAGKHRIRREKQCSTD